jgi:hypothetical protein
MEVSPNERLIASQAAFRAANERLAGVAGRGPADRIVPFLCECADDECRGRVNMSVPEYRAIHDDRDRYATLRDHATADGEEVIERRELFDIVQKAAAAA